MPRPVRQVRVSRWLLFLALAMPAATAGRQAQPAPGPPPPPPKPGTAFILGRVVDAGSGRPIAGAIVSLIGTSGAVPGAPPIVPEGFVEGLVPGGPSQPRQVVADSEGRFVFRGLTQGSLGLSVRAPGYVVGAYGQRRPGGPSRQIALEDDQKVMDATIRLWKFASIGGRMVDEAGEPAIGMSLNLVRVTTVGGRRRLVPAGIATTDDRGAYRFGSITPGTYMVHMRSTVTTVPTPFIEAYEQSIGQGLTNSDIFRDMMSAGISTSPGVRVGDNQIQLSNMIGRALPPPPPRPDGALWVYQSVFYPGATLSAQATPLTLASGEERSGIDLQLKLTRAVTVSGTVTGPDGPVAMLALRLQPGGIEDFTSDNGLEAAATVSRADGSFTFLGVPSGQYTLRGQKVPRPPLAAGSGMTMVIQSGSGGIAMSSGPGTPTPTPTEPTLWAQTSVSVGESDLPGVSISLARGARVSGRIEFEGGAAKPAPDRLAQMSVSMTSADGGFLSGFTSGRVAADGTSRRCPIRRESTC